MSINNIERQPVFRLLEKISSADVSNLNEKQLQIFEFRALGLSEREIAGKLNKAYSTVKNEISWCLGEYKQIEIISLLFNNGMIDREKIKKSFDFNRYNRLNDRDKGIIGLAASKDNWEKTADEVAHQSGFKHRPRLGRIYKKLGVKSLLRLRIFMLLKEDQDKEMQAENPYINPAFGE